MIKNQKHLKYNSSFQHNDHANITAHCVRLLYFKNSSQKFSLYVFYLFTEF